MKKFLLIPCTLALVAWAPTEPTPETFEPNFSEEVLISQAITPVLMAGMPIAGRLESGDTTLQSGEFVDYFTYNATAQESVTFALNSAEFDTYLMLRGSGLTVDNDDVTPGNFNSQIVHTFAMAGAYQVAVTSYAPGEVGGYTVTATSSSGPNPGQVYPGQVVPNVVQNTGPVNFGQPISGTLAAGDDVLDSGEFVDYLTFQGTAGQQITLDMNSGQFDTYLGLFGPAGFQTANDDGPGIGLNSRISTVLPADGEYQIQATSYTAGMQGTYSLALNTASPTVGMPATTSLGIADLTSGALDANDQRLSSGEFYDEYTIDGTAGQQLVINATSAAFDTYLMLRSDSLNLDNDDMVPGNFNSEIQTTLPINGSYRVIVTSYAPGEMGAYTLTMNQLGVANQPPQGTPTTGQSAQDTLSATDPTRRTGQYFRSHTFDGTAGQRVVVDMSSATMDTYLILRGPNGFEEHNDDIVYAQDTNSRIDMVLPSTGQYEVQASTYSIGETGTYDLAISMNEHTVRPPTAPTTVTENNTAPAMIGDPGTPIIPTVNGRLEAGDQTLDSGEFNDTYTFNGDASQGVTINLVSPDFDTYLIVWGPNGYQEDNDDFPGMGFNSQLELGLPETGVYTVAVTSYAPGETGGYTLNVTNGTSAQTAGTGRIYAILSGITNYADGDTLPFCADDAEKLYEDLAATGLLAEQSVLLMDSQVTRANLEAAFQQIAQVITPEDEFMFFYSGHGSQIASSDPVELDGMDETLYIYDGNVTDDVVAGWFDLIDARLATIALDSCFSGGFARDVIAESNRMGFFSSEEDVLSTTAESFQAGGYLSHFLRTGISGEADVEPADNVVTVGELTQYLRRQWATNVLDNQVSSSDGARTYQNLVIERGGVSLSDVVVYPPR